MDHSYQLSRPFIETIIDYCNDLLADEKFLKLRHRNFTGSVLHEEISISINKNDYLFCWLGNMCIGYTYTEYS